MNLSLDFSNTIQLSLGTYRVQEVRFSSASRNSKLLKFSRGTVPVVIRRQRWVVQINRGPGVANLLPSMKWNIEEEHVQ